MKFATGVLAAVVFLGFWFPGAWAGSVKWFDANGNPVDQEEYESIADTHQVKVELLKEELRSMALSLTDEKGRPLFTEDGVPMDYPDDPGAFSDAVSGQASSRPKSKWIVHGREYNPRLKSGKASGPAPKEGEPFGVKGMSHAEAGQIDKAIFDRAFQRAAATGDFSGLEKWKQGTHRRQAGMFTTDEYDPATKKIK